MFSRLRHSLVSEDPIVKALPLQLDFWGSCDNDTCWWECTTRWCQMIHRVTLEPIAEIATGSREHPKLWPRKQILQHESRGSDSLSLIPAAQLLKRLLKIWLLLNITLICSLSAISSCKLYGEILPPMWQKYLITLQNLNFPVEASTFPILNISFLVWSNERDH